MTALALLPFAAGFIALLNPPLSRTLTCTSAWLICSLLLTYLGFSAASVAYQAWGADRGINSRERTQLTAAREGFGLIGVVLAAALPSVIAPSINEGIARLSWLLPPLLLIAGVCTLYGKGANEILFPPRREPLLPSLCNVLADAAFRRLLIVFMVNGIASALPATLFLFFVADVLHLQRAGGPLLALYFVSGAASLPLWVGFSKRRGRVAAWVASMGLSIAAFAGASLLQQGDLWPFALICFASGLALGADITLPAAIAADIGERQRQVGACFGVWNFAAKLNLALAAGVSLPLLDFFGYVPGNGEGLDALTFTYALLPLAFKALAGALLFRWRHTLEIES